MPYPYEKSYPCRSKWLYVAGYGLLIAGIFLLFCCIPLWAWLALLGVLLMAAGFVLLGISHAWR